MTPAEPPRWLTALLRVAAGPRADDIEGDLREWMLRWSRAKGLRFARRKGIAVGLGMVPRLLGARLARRARSSRGWSLEARLALRLLRRHPALTLTSVLALSVTMGLATAAWTLTSSALFGSLPVPGGDRIALLRLRDGVTRQELYPTVAEYRAWSASAAFEVTGAFVSDQANLATPDGAPHQVRAARLTPSVFELNPVVPVLGTLFSDTGVAENPDVVLLGEGVWEDLFGRDPGVVGSVLEVNGRPHTVLGVLPEAYRFPSDHVAFLPLAPLASPGPGATVPGMRLVGRLARGATREAAATESEARLRTAPPLPDRTPAVEVLPYTRGFVSPGVDLAFASGVAALVLLVAVAAANVANLVLARTAARTTEMAIRTALGASRPRIVGQLFVEALGLTLLAAVVAVAGSTLALGWLRSVLTELPYWVDFRPRLPVLAFAAGLAALAAVLAGAVPALRATGRRGAHGLRTRPGAGFGRLSRAVIVAELGLSMALLATAFCLGQGLLGYARQAHPLPGREVLVAGLGLRWEGEEVEGETLHAFSERLRSGVRREMADDPRSRGVGFTLTLPGREGREVGIEVEGREGRRAVRQVEADEGFFDALDVQAVAGRTFTSADGDEGAPPVVLVNTPFVEEILAGRNALGRRLRFFGPDGTSGGWHEIVGIVPDLGHNPAAPGAGAAVYRTLPGSNYLEVAVRAREDPLALLPSLRVAAASVDPRIQVRNARLLADAARDERALLRGAGTALFFLGSMALLLSSAGLYAVLSFGVTRRRREIGVRMALGAPAAEVARSVVARTLVQIGTGLALGTALGWALLRLLPTVAPITVEVDPLLHLGLPGALLAAAGVTAVWSPLRRALSVRPAEVLRSE